MFILDIEFSPGTSNSYSENAVKNIRLDLPSIGNESFAKLIHTGGKAFKRRV